MSDNWGDPETVAELDAWQQAQPRREPSEAAMRPYPRYKEPVWDATGGGDGDE